MKTDVFAYDSYLEIIEAFITANENLRGYKTLLAEAARCKTTYLSHILAGKANISPEQAYGLCGFWSLSELEREYFLTLVDHDRSGENSHRQYLKKKLAELRKANRDMTKKLNKPTISEEMLKTYYSSPHYGAVHLLLTIPACREEKVIAERLDLPLKTVRNILATLQNIGLASHEKGEWKPLAKDLHVPIGSAYSAMNHIQWRFRANQDLVQKNLESVHYTSLQTISQKDFEKLSKLIADFLKENREIALASPEEELTVLLLDFFKV